MALETIGEHRCHGGVQGFYGHASQATGTPMRFAVYLPPAARHLNNLLMLGAVVLFAASAGKSRIFAGMRHPMLTGLLTWAAAHLLVRGDLAAMILFGGLGAWALFSMWLINAREPGDWPDPNRGTRAGDIRLAVISVGVYVGIGLLHGWLGPWPFPG